jgi:hypothetical protein
VSVPPEPISAHPREARDGRGVTSAPDPAARARMRTRARARRGRLGTALAIALGAVLLRVIGGVGFANYDTLYALVWGGELARGTTPQYGIPIAPTPHPLVEALGFVLSPLSPRAIEDVTVALGFLALSACAWAVYRLGALWFNRPAGAVAALLLITRVPILSYGVRAYVDVPYLLLVLCALILETRRRRAGASVLALLALAGLLRPEAWIFSGLYWLYLALPAVRAARGAHRTRDSAASASRPRAGVVPAGGFGEEGNGFDVRTPRQLAGLALIVLGAPVLWVASDWLITGNALWSLTNTRHTALTLGRETGIAEVPEWVPRRIGEILGPVVLAGAALGGALTLWWLRSRALLGATVGIVAVVVLAAFASAGLPIDTRYAFVPAALLCVFCGAGLCGWMLLARGDRRRRWWIAGAALVLVALLAYVPTQYRVDHDELRALARQQRIQDDLVALVDRGAIRARCEPIGVPNHAPIPLLTLYLRGDPGDVISAQQRAIARGTYLEAADREAREDYVLDLAERAHRVSVPPGFAASGGNRSWRIYEHCQ